MTEETTETMDIPVAEQAQAEEIKTLTEYGIDKHWVVAVAHAFYAKPVRQDHSENVIRINQAAANFATELVKLCPRTQELNTAISKVQESQMWALKSLDMLV